MQAKSKEIQDPRKKEQGEEAGVGDAKLALLKFLPRLTLLLNMQLICSTEEMREISIHSP